MRPAGQRADALHELGGALDLGAFLAAVPGELGLQGVAGLEERVHHEGRDGQLVAAQLVEQRLELVRELRHVGEAEGGRAALDGVGRAEDRVQVFLHRLGHVDREQEPFHGCEVLGGLLEEDAVELGEIERDGALRRVAGFGHGIRLRGWRE